MALILRYSSNCEPIQSFLAGELEIHLWSLVGHEMTIARLMSSFSGPEQTLFLWLCGGISPVQDWKK